MGNKAHIKAYSMYELTFPTPLDFRFWTTVGSHGWCQLPPFSYDEAAQSLTRLEQLRDGTFVRMTITDAGDSRLRVALAGLSAPPSAAQEAEITALIGRMLNLDQPIDEFHLLVRDEPHYGWIARIGGGRMLASATVWEDLAKTLMTTNTTWRMTIGMVTRLTELGTAAPDGGCAFPTPAQIAALTPEALNAHVRAGYRGAYLHELATRMVDGTFDAEALRDPSLTSAEVYKRLIALKGFGAYAAGAMMRLLGRFDELGLDSECRAAFVRLYNDGQPATDKQIAAHYQRFGRWRGLVVWMDVMKSYLVETLDRNE
jgi:3-methyladenine DNA glycosylase/8-oxoguanine DNA glycosylase